MHGITSQTSTYFDRFSSLIILGQKNPIKVALFIISLIGATFLYFRRKIEGTHWVDLNHQKIGEIVDSIHSVYQKNPDAAGFVIKLSSSKKWSVETKNGFHGSLKKCSFLSRCALCNQKSVPVDIQNGMRFSLVKSLSRTPLIIDKENVTLNWTEMGRESQIRMILAAQKVANAFKEHGKVASSYLELHCHPAGFQTVGHTHLRLEGILDGSKPSEEVWNNLTSEIQ